MELEPIEGIELEQAEDGRWGWHLAASGQVGFASSQAEALEQAMAAQRANKRVEEAFRP